MSATVVQWERKMSLVTAFWWEGTGKNKEKIKDRKRPDGDSIEPKPNYIMNSNFSSKDLVKWKITYIENI